MPLVRVGDEDPAELADRYFEEFADHEFIDDMKVGMRSEWTGKTSTLMKAGVIEFLRKNEVRFADEDLLNLKKCFKRRQMGKCEPQTKNPHRPSLR